MVLEKGVGKGVGNGWSSLKGRILGAIKENNTITISLLAKELETTSRTIERNLHKLKQKNSIRRRGGRKEGMWEIMEEEDER